MAEVLTGLLTDADAPQPKRTRKGFMSTAAEVVDFFHRVDVTLARGMKPLEYVGLTFTDSDKKQWGKSAPRTAYLEAKKRVEEAGDTAKDLQVSLYRSLKGEVLRIAAAPPANVQPKELPTSSSEGTGGGAAVGRAKETAAGKRKVR